MNELEALKDAVRSLLSAAGPDSWPRLAKEIGVAALIIPEEFGGAGAGLAEACAVLEELGAVLSPAPMLGSAVLATSALLSAGHHDYLQALAEGNTTATLAWTGVTAENNRLTGTANYLLEGELVFVLTATGLYKADAKLQPMSTMDETRPLFSLTLDNAPAEFLGTPDVDRLRDIACVALAAEQTGAAAKALDITVEYVKTRVQFGRSIGSFQAIQHRLADLYVLCETARSAYLAALDGRPESAAVARIHCTEAFSAVTAEMIQMHGGIGITWEHDAHRYFKRAHSSAMLFGQPSSHLRRLEPIALS